MLTIRKSPKSRVLYNQKFFTIHTNVNNAYTMKPKSNERTCMVAFKNSHDAILVGGMIEEYYNYTREWPDFEKVGLRLPHGTIKVLNHLEMRASTFDSIKEECARNVLNIFLIEAIHRNKDAYSMRGSIIQLNNTLDFYKARFDELINGTEA